MGKGILMVENKLEQEIIQLYDTNLVNLFSINEISKKLNKKYPYINKKVTSLIEEGILNKIVVGRSYLCSLNLQNDKTIILLSLNEINKRCKAKMPEIETFVSKNNIQFSIISVVKSDDSTIFIVNDLKVRMMIQRAFEDAIVVNKDEFTSLLFEDPEIFRKHVVVYGHQNFFEMIRGCISELKNEYSPLRY